MRVACSAAALLAGVRCSVREVRAEGGDWRSVIDGLRRCTPRIWRALPEREARRFLRVVRPFWEVHRHRMPPQIAAQIAALKDGGALVSTAARVVCAEATSAEVRLRIKPRGSELIETLRADWVVNCTGPGAGSSVASTPVVGSLVAGGFLELDALGLGVRTDAEGRSLVNGTLRDDLVVVGTLRKAELWESTAVPELRLQAGDAARAIAKRLGWLAAD